MSNEVRIYLYLFWSESDYEIKVGRDIDSLLKLWHEKREASQYVSGFLHMGASRPDIDSISDLLVLNAGFLILSEPVRWVLKPETLVSSAPISYIKFRHYDYKMPIYIGTQGWGYSVPDEIFCQQAVEDEPEVSLTSDSWIDHIKNHDSELTSMLVEYRIHSDTRYLEVRHDIDNNCRHRLDTYRANILLNSIESENPFEILKIAPSWLLESNVKMLDLPTRLYNIFAHQRVNLVGDLQRYTYFSILKVTGFGRKGISDLSKGLQKAIRDNNFTKPESPSTPEIEKDSMIYGNLYSQFIDAISRLNERSKEVIDKRLGISGKRKTLVEIGEEFGVSRERIRQIESKAIDKIRRHGNWYEVISLKLKERFDDRSKPLYLDTIEAEDPWFEGFMDNPEFLGNIIEFVLEPGYKVIFHKERPILAKLDQDDFEKLQNHILDYMKRHADGSLSSHDVKFFIQTSSASNNCPELSEIILESISPLLHFARSEDGSSRLISVGRGVNHLVKLILTESKEPLHYSVVHAKCEEMTGEPVELRRVHQCLLTESGAKLFGRGKYGLPQHIPIDESIRNQILDEVELIILTSSSGRQWHCTELVEILEEKRPDLSELIDPYLLNIVLEDSNILHYLGRMIWVGVLVDNIKNLDRVELAQGCIALLEKSGCPLSETQLKQMLSEVRGTRSQFLIHPNEVVARTEPGVWGLVDRDFFLNRQERELLFSHLYDILEMRQKELHITEIADALRKGGLYFPRGLTAYMVQSLAQIDEKGRFRLRKGQLLGLTAWPELRRLTLSESFRQALNAVTLPVAFDELLQWVSLFAEREVPPGELSSKLYYSDLIYNEQLKVWEKREDMTENVVLHEDEHSNLS